MSRVKNALRALRGDPPEIREVEVVKEVTKVIHGDAVDVYVAGSKMLNAHRRVAWITGAVMPPSHVGKVYRTCAQAYAEIGEDCDLTMRKAVIHEGRCYLIGEIREVKLEPKPKRPKRPKGRAK